MGNRPLGTCAVTGASGYVGSRVADHLANAGWDVIALCRKPPDASRSQVSHIPYDLATTPSPETLAGVDALVHAAYDFSHTRQADITRVNVEGSRLLFAAAREARIDRVIYISSVAAFPGARSLYGRAKLETERLATEVGASVVRPGLVWGPQGAAILGALSAAVERLPIVPLPAPRELEFTLVHEGDLALLVERILGLWPDVTERLFVAASDQALTLLALLRSVAEQAGRRRYFVQVPWRGVWLALRALEAAGITPPFRSDSLLSLVNTDPEPLARATGDPARYGVRFRDYIFT